MEHKEMVTTASQAPMVLNNYMVHDNVLLPISTTSRKPPPEQLWCNLPYEIGSIICEYLEVDYCGYLFMISKLWSILPTEKVYAFLCFQIFRTQTFKKMVNVVNWGSWKNMLIHRPRLRTNGIYSLRTTYWKPPVNERFWEEKIHEFPESIFYRHFRFFNDGRILYSLCNLHGDEMYTHLQSYQAQPARKIYEGSYQLMKDVVIVKIPTHYADITFTFQIRNLSSADEGGSDDLYAGHHNVLKLTQHSAEIIRQNQTTHVQYELPNYSNFLFYRYWF